MFCFTSANVTFFIGINKYPSKKVEYEIYLLMRLLFEAMVNKNTYLYNSYGYNEHSPGATIPRTENAPSRFLGDIYTQEEAYADWRKELIQHITNEAVKTRNHVTVKHDETREFVKEQHDVTKQHVTTEVDSAETAIINKITKESNDIQTKVANEASSLRSLINNVHSIVSAISNKIK